MLSKIPFSQIGCIVTTTSFLYQVLYVVPEQQRQIKTIKKYLNINEENQTQKQACPLKIPHINTKIIQEYWMEMRKYND